MPNQVEVRMSITLRLYSQKGNMLSTLFEIATKFSSTNLKTALAILRHNGPVALVRPLIWFVLKRRGKTSFQEKYSFLLEPEFDETSSGEVKVLFIVHIYFPEFVDRFIRGAAQLQRTNWKFVVTSSNSQILEMVKTASERDGLHEVCTMRVPNKGRNISPFIQALGEHGGDRELVIHVHSKRSEHAKERDIKSWVDSQWHLLFDNPNLVKRVIDVFAAYPQVSIVYPAIHRILSPWTYTWSINAQKARRILLPLGISVKNSERIAFPAGAMFAARIRDLRFLEELNLEPEKFPEEKGQLDGELHHVVERLFGYVPAKNGRLHAIYFPDSDAFTTEEKALTDNYDWSTFNLRP